MQAVVDVWQLFEAEFVRLWDEHSDRGDAYPAVLFGKSAIQGRQAQQASQRHKATAQQSAKCSRCFTPL